MNQITTVSSVDIGDELTLSPERLTFSEVVRIGRPTVIGASEKLKEAAVCVGDGIFDAAAGAAVL
jgi:hypothetical protein